VSAPPARPDPVLHRTFTLDDQRAFARLSGDWNPLHVDPVAARRTMFEGPVVHGIHLLLWALDAWLPGAVDGTAPPSAGAAGPGHARAVELTRLKVAFRKPALVGAEVALAFAATAAEEVTLTARSHGQHVLEATVAWRAAPPSTAAPAEHSWPPAPPVVVDRAAIAAQNGALALALDRALADALLPRATRYLGGAAVAELLAMTRLVGMECPGLHSVFAGLTLERREAAAPEVEYAVSLANLKYSMVHLAVRGPTLAGTLATFYRPVPFTPPAPDEIRRALGALDLTGQRALVIGGSRGLGEMFARCVALAGGQVLLTYHRGAADAERVVAGCEGRARAAALDVTQPATLAGALRTTWHHPQPPTHLYYLATPRIPGVGRYHRTELDTMLAYYVEGLVAAVEAAVALGGPLVVWVPSTVFLSEGGGNAAYCMAKAAMEELCRRLPQMLPVQVRCPRLPRIATDQNASLIQVEVAPPLDIVVGELGALAQLTG